jgi:hypothetical protein
LLAVSQAETRVLRQQFVVPGYPWIVSYFFGFRLFMFYLRGGSAGLQSTAGHGNITLTVCCAHPHGERRPQGYSQASY